MVASWSVKLLRCKHTSVIFSDRGKRGISGQEAEALSIFNAAPVNDLPHVG